MKVVTLSLFSVAAAITTIGLVFSFGALFNLSVIDSTRPDFVNIIPIDKASSGFITVQQEPSNDSQNLSELTRAQLEQEIQRMQNILNPRNISQAFMPGQTHSVNQSENPYQEMKEGTIAGLGNSTNP